VNAWIAVPVAIVVGVALVVSASRATVTVDQGKTFVGWMLVVFACFLVLASLPVVLAL
jgi:hypothetical protein